MGAQEENADPACGPACREGGLPPRTPASPPRGPEAPETCALCLGFYRL